MRLPGLIDLVRGLLMGGADVIPGVSGGTVALVLGIYRRLLGSIRHASGVPVALVRHRPDRLRAAWAGVEWAFVLPLITGIAIAIVAGSMVIPPLREAYPIEMRALFLGLVAGSVPVPWRRIARVGRRELVVAAGTALAAFVLVGLPPRDVFDPALWIVPVAAAVAICAMILPGVSGAFLLETMGLYTPTLQAVRDRDVAYVAVFVIGAAIGLALFARLLTWLLERHEDLTMAALVGLMVGALRALWPWLGADRALLPPPTPEAIFVPLLLVLIGSAAVTALVASERLLARGGPPPRARG